MKLIWTEATRSLGEENVLRRELINVVNLQDKMMNTALHYATQLWPQEVVRYVLELGANIGVKNVYDEVQIENIIVINCIQTFCCWKAVD